MESSGPPQGPPPGGSQAPQPGPQSPQGYPPAPAAPQTFGGVQQQPFAPAAPVDPHYGQKFPLGRAWGFYIISFGLWGIWWFYTTRRELDREIGDGRDDAVLHLVLMLVPFVNIVGAPLVTYWLWRDISMMRERVGLSGFSAGGYLVGLILLSFLIIGPPLFYSLVLDKLNEYWDRRAGGEAAVRQITTAEKIVVGVGVALLAMYVLFIIVFIIIGAAASSS